MARVVIMAVVVEGELQPDMYHSDKDNTMRLDLRLRAYNVTIADRADRTDRDARAESKESDSEPSGRAIDDVGMVRGEKPRGGHEKAANDEKGDLLLR